LSHCGSSSLILDNWLMATFAQFIPSDGFSYLDFRPAPSLTPPCQT
jgi:hypothetical protein